MLTAQRKCVSSRVCVCVFACASRGRREGGRGVSFKACSAHCLSNLTHLFHLSLLLSSPPSLPPPTSPCFGSVCHFLPAPLLSVSHLNLRHLSHAAAHVLPDLYCFSSSLIFSPTNLAVASSSQLLRSAFSARLLCQESGADRGGCMRSISAKSWSILSPLPLSALRCSHYSGRERHSFFVWKLLMLSHTIVAVDYLPPSLSRNCQRAQ